MRMNVNNKAKDLVSQMTLEEKAGLCSGKNFWETKGIARLGIQDHMLTDGPHGLRKQLGGSDHLGINKSVPATSFPTAATSACSFDSELLHEMGEALGEKCIREQVSVILGPGANIKRSPLCGRNFEYFSEDPYLAGEMAAAWIDGVQSKGIGTSLKHFAANNQETRRMSIDSVVDDRALHEIYLTAFEKAVKQSQPWTVMCSYNKINGTYASDNKWLLTDVLRTDWGFQGLVVTDWGANNNRVKALNAGTDLEMPYSGEENTKRIIAAVKNGEIPKEQVDAAAIRVVEMALKAQETMEQAQKVPSTRNEQMDHELARKIARESMVLLKNKGILPLKKEAKVLFLGKMAKEPRYQGAGSSKIVPSFLDNAYDAAVEAGYLVEYEPDYKKVESAEALAKEAEAVVIFAGLPDEYESEGYDRTNMDMPEEQNQLIEAVANVNQNVVVVLQCGSPVTLPWKNQVAGILLAYLGGQAGGHATVDLLWGNENPCGKLAETWPVSLDDTPCRKYFPGHTKSVEYRESIYVGYRYYDTVKCPVNYPFGYGLSYTTFEYKNMTVVEKAKNRFEVQVTIQNTGSHTGKEIVQLYIEKKSSKLFRAEKELKGFTKVELSPGEEKIVILKLSEESFRYYNSVEKQFCVEGGEYTVLAGASSRNLPLSAKVEVQGDGKEELLIPLMKKLSEYWLKEHPYQQNEEHSVVLSTKQFEILLGHPIPPEERNTAEPFTIESTVEDMKDTFTGKQMIKQMEKAMGGLVADNTDAGMERMAREMMFSMPLRSLTMTGAMNLNQVEGLAEMANKHYIHGLKKLLQK